MIKIPGDKMFPRTTSQAGITIPQIAGGIIVLGLLIWTGVTLFMQMKFANFQPPQPPAGVVVSKVANYDFSDKIEALGTAQADESAVLTARVTETVQSINFEEGQQVAAGTVLALLTSDEEQASLEESSKSYDRYSKLAQSKIGSVARRDEEQARMKTAQAQMNDRRIVAPFDGIIGIRKVSVGDLVSPGTVITTIDDIDPIELEFSIPESFLSTVRQGMEIQARTTAYPDETFTGKIIAIDPRVNAMTRAFLIKAQIDNGDHKLRPGLLMGVDIFKSRRTALAIPEEAIISAGDTKSVYVVGEDNKVVKKDITVGERNIGYIEVTGGLSENEKVIVEGQIKTGPGAEVSIVGERTIGQTVGQAVEFAVPRKQEALDELQSEGNVPQSESVPETPPVDAAASATQEAPQETAPAEEPAADATPASPDQESPVEPAKE